MRLCDSTNPLEWYSDLNVKNRFRLSKRTVLWINDKLKDDLNRPTNRHCALNSVQQITTALYFFSCGSYQRVIGDTSGISMSRSAVSKTVKNVAKQIAMWRSNFVLLPTGEERDLISSGFQSKCKFPGVVGAIDGTHISIQKPPNDNGLFVNRKGFNSLNCQFVCDHRMKFLDVVVR